MSQTKCGIENLSIQCFGAWLMSTIKLACIGDVMCGDSGYHIGWGIATQLRLYGSNFLAPEIVNILKEHDIVFCNLESVLSDVSKKNYCYRSIEKRGDPQTAKILSEWGINIANVANNHILEHGRDAAIDTVKNLHESGIHVVGAGKNNAFVPGIESLEYEINGFTISFFGICFHNSKHAFSLNPDNVDYLISSVKNKSKKGHIVLVSIHWGDELIDRPSIKQRKLVKDIKAVGAKLVIGHHPHVYQGIEINKYFFCIYSLGNFIFDNFLESTSWSVIASITMRNGEIASYNNIPIVRGKNFRPFVPIGNHKAKILHEVERRNRLVSDRILDDQTYRKLYKNELEKLEFESRRILWKRIFKNFKKYKKIYWPQILFRPIQRRLGIW